MIKEVKKLLTINQLVSRPVLVKEQLKEQLSCKVLVMHARNTSFLQKIIFRISSKNSEELHKCIHKSVIKHFIHTFQSKQNEYFHTKIVKNNKAVARTVKSPLAQACISLKYIRITSSQMRHTFLLLIWSGLYLLKQKLNQHF